MVLIATRRLIIILFISIAIIYFSFLGVYMMDSDIPDDTRPQLGEAARQAIQDARTFISGLLQGDVGTTQTVSGPRPIDEIVWEALKNSMGLLAISLSVAALIGIIIGHLAALAKKRRHEYSLLLFSLIGISAPSFLIAVLLQQAGIKYTTTFGRQLVSMGGYGWDLRHLALPLLVLIARPLAYITSATFVSLSSILEQDFIRTAYAKGLSVWDTTIMHALRNLAVPVLTSLGVSFRFSLSTLVLVEFIFAWPGLGLRFMEAITDKAAPLVAAIALTIGLLIQVSLLGLDLAYRFIDPRLRESH